MATGCAAGPRGFLHGVFLQPGQRDPSRDLGAGALEGVQGYAGLGAAGNPFGGQFLRVDSNGTTTLTLSGLPPHTHIDIDFLFAAIDSWDGSSAPFPSGDFFVVTLDGVTIFNESFENSNAGFLQTYVPPAGGELARKLDLGFSLGVFWNDSAYDMSREPRFHGIPHTAATATITFAGAGAGWQGGADESWAIDNLRVKVATQIPVVPVTYPTPVLTDVTINDGAGDQIDPHVSGDWASYSSDLSIRYYQFSADGGVDAQIPMGSSVRDTLSDVSGSRIVFSRTIPGVGAAVMLFDAATGAAPSPIDSAPGTIRLGSAIGGNTVAYIDFGLHQNGELVIHDLATSTSVRITNDDAYDQNLAVSPSGDVVVWDRCPISVYAWRNCDIWQAVKTGGTWSVSAATATSNLEVDPDSNGTLIVYASLRAGSSDIFWRPVAGGPEMQLQSAGFERGPTIAGDFIAYEGQASILAATDIFVYDVVNNRLFQITDTTFVNEQLSDITLLPDGRLRLVWASDEDGFDQRNIKSATFALPNVAPSLAYSTETGYGSDGVSPDSGSMARFFTYKVVYADFNDQPPSFVDVCIDGTCRAMTVDTTAEASLQDGDYKNGEQYSYSRGFSSAGVHAYFFEASDGTDTARLPVSGTFAGPSVSDLRITTTGLPDATVGVPYAVTVTAAGGTPPYTWELSHTRNFPFNVMGPTISGTATAAGGHGVVASVMDAVGDSVFTGFGLTVNAAPSTPPVLVVPGTITVNATSPAGAVVSYVVTATDAVDPNPVVACSPASGSTFPGGTTLVSCTATNTSGLQSTASFNVVVKGAADQISDLIALVMSFNLKQGIENSLDAKLQNVLAALSAAGAGQKAAACNKLDAFIHEVMAQSGKAITTLQAGQLVAASNQVKAALGCP